MKKIISLLAVLSLVMVLFAACSSPASEKPAEVSSSVVESSESSVSSDDSTDSEIEESSQAGNNGGEEKTFEEMKKLFVMDGERTNERLVETSLTYTISGKTLDEIVEFMEKGIAAMGAVENTLITTDSLYQYTGDYGDDEGLTVSVTESSDGVFLVAVTY